jgi:hypothetical protein
MSAPQHPDRARIYVSFAEPDRPRVMQLVRWLNDSGWYVRADDRHAFPGGDDWKWSAAIRLDACDVALCVVTTAWLVSDSCRFEFSYSAKRGKFVLPVLCEPGLADVLPPALRALPRVDLSEGRMVDYLVLKDTLVQAGTRAARPVPASLGARLRDACARFAGRLLRRRR